MDAVVDLRPPTRDDADEIARVVAAQETAWWGAPDGDIDDVLDQLERVEMAAGSLEAGARLAVVDGAVVGVGLHVGHGHTDVSVDPSSMEADGTLLALVDWLLDHGGTEVEAPSQDHERLALLASRRLMPTRSSFELERSADVSDLPGPTWSGGVVPIPFRVGLDDEELHAMIYSFWTDVPGHTYRPIDEWRPLLLGGSRFDPDLVVVARTGDGVGPLVGCAIGGVVAGNVGWVSQLGVAPAARGVGLGRSLLLEVCRRLGATDATIIALGVEADNANALGLYRSVGLEIAREWIHCSRR